MLNHYSFKSLEHLDPATLTATIKKLIHQYQLDRSSFVAWIISLYGEVLSKHPDYDDNTLERCSYQRFSDQWRWIARQTHQQQPALIPATLSPTQHRETGKRIGTLREKGLYL